MDGWGERGCGSQAPTVPKAHPMPPMCQGLVLPAFHGQTAPAIYGLFGGYSYGSFDPLNDLWRYDPGYEHVDVDGWDEYD